MILCKDCNHVRKQKDGYVCHHPSNVSVSFITGESFCKQTIAVFRIDKCTIDKAHYFEPKRGD